jgi:plasmid stabilization system protein ParE
LSARDPERHRIRKDIYRGCRIAYKGRHAILYRIKAGRPEVARILHVAMDLGGHVPEFFFDEPDD